jgi:hypothetical protein
MKIDFGSLPGFGGAKLLRCPVCGHMHWHWSASMTPPPHSPVSPPVTRLIASSIADLPAFSSGNNTNMDTIVLR